MLKDVYMNNYLCIVNRGEIEPEALTLLGASTKQDDDSKIGFFGSGNKYAIATFLRNNVGVKILSGMNEIEVTTEPVTLRSMSFDRILINKEHTSLTTRTGPEWELWMALREFICNAIDEGDYSLGITDTISPEAGKTKIYLTHTEELEDLYNNMEKIICTKSLYSNEIGDIIGGEDWTVYRKSIRCVDMNTDEHSLFNYNFHNLDINESRLYCSSYQLQRLLAEIILTCTDTNIVLKYLEAFQEKKSAYSDINYCSFGYTSVLPSDTWVEALKDKTVLSRALSGYVENALHYVILPTTLVQKLREVGVRCYGDQDDYYEVEPTEEMCQHLEHSLAYLRSCNVDIDLRVKFVKFSTDDNLARQVDDLILLSNTLPKEEYYTALLEEWTHYKTGYHDLTRALQTHLFEQWWEALKRTVKPEHERAIAAIKALKEVLEEIV